MTERRRREPKLTAQLVIMELPDVAGRLRAWAEVRELDIAEVCREVVRAGLATLEPEWIRQPREGYPDGGELDPAFLAAHVENSIKRRRAAAA
jgi:hypothetical protein